MFGDKIPPCFTPLEAVEYIEYSILFVYINVAVGF